MTRWPSVVRSVVQHVKLGRAKRSVPMLRRRWISSSSQSSRGTTVTERSPRPTTSLTTCSSVPAEVWPRWRRLLESQSPTTAICGCGPIRCGGRLRDGACRCPDRQTAVFGRPVRDPSPGRSAALTAAFGTELTAGELHGLKDGRGDSPPLRLSWLRRALEKRLPRESDLVPMPAAKGSASHTREIPSQPGSRGTRSARGAQVDDLHRVGAWSQASRAVWMTAKEGPGMQPREPGQASNHRKPSRPVTQSAKVRRLIRPCPTPAEPHAGGELSRS
jgi:hypothetical protein